ncbi:dopey family protein [Schizosaccharomyces cryophilus OY26]|uniref:Dopey family protein n=1 Tax=Schizosaccharomyces cryophilus (strain OY26 / ATCC MYA-4695 / CBS 11777 / NBRC 106824 / NRRL Y48691) TaxID=653667 RepID=S9VNV6_SCHCR|nr:dopey family protein [Schizosaccharomyces cryophilus OY26]EPY49658.1 dopey family protein [Schizosaccharomyces cryophilus OY26]
MIDTTNDAKFRKYQDAIRKCIALFQTVEQWPDYISYLTKLHKVLQLYSSFKTIPCNLLVSRSLAECLSPGLPSGVHKKALEVYDYVFTILEKDVLAEELTVWTYGLTPFFSISSIKTKNDYINIMRKHYVTLGRSIRPCFQAVFISLLSGLEEESDEHSQETLVLIDDLIKGLDDDKFAWGSIWSAILSFPSQRPGALLYLLRTCNSHSKEEVHSKVIQPDPSLVTRALAAAISDNDVLVQRGYMDALLHYFSIRSPFLQRVKSFDLKLLHMSVASIILRNDLSLNRRFYAWLMGLPKDSELSGPDPADEMDPSIILENMAVFIEGIRDLLSSKTSIISIYKAFRILYTLSDRKSIFSVIESQILPFVFQAYHTISISTYKKDSKHLHDSSIDYGRRLIMRFNDLTIYEFLFKCIRDYVTNKEKHLASLEMFHFSLRNQQHFFNGIDEEYFFLFFFYMIFYLKNNLSLITQDSSLDLFISTCSLLVNNFKWSSFKDYSMASSSEECHSKAIYFLERRIREMSDFPEGRSLYSESVSSLLYFLSEYTYIEKFHHSVLSFLLQLLKEAIDPKVEYDFLGITIEGLSQKSWNFQELESLVSFLPSRMLLSSNHLVHLVLETVWDEICVNSYLREEKSLDIIWILQEKLQNKKIESFFSTCVVKQQMANKTSAIYQISFYDTLRKSAQHSLFHAVFDRPLLLLLSSLLGDRPEKDLSALINWLSSSTALQLRVLELITGNLLLQSPNLSTVHTLGNDTTKYNIIETQRNSQASQCFYFFRISYQLILHSELFISQEDLLASSKEIEKLCLISWADTLLVKEQSLNYTSFLAILMKSLLDIFNERHVIKEKEDVYKLYSWAFKLFRQIIQVWSEPLDCELQVVDSLLALVKNVEPDSDSSYQDFLLNLLSLLGFLQPRLKSSNYHSAENRDNIRNFIMAGLSNNDPIICSRWLKVINGFLPNMLQDLPILVIPSIQFLSSLIDDFLKQHEAVYRDFPKSLRDRTYMDVFIFKLETLSTMIARVIQHFPYTPSSKRSMETSGLIGNVISGVFSNDTSASSVDISKRLSMLLVLQDAVRTLFSCYSWDLKCGFFDKGSKVFVNDTASLKEAAAKGILRLYEHEPMECVEMLAYIYINYDSQYSQCVWELFSFLSEECPERIIKHLTSSFFARETVATYNGPSSLTIKVTQMNTLDCICSYVGQLKENQIPGVFPEISKFLREIIISSNSFKDYLLVSLRILFLISKHINNNSDSRQQKEFFDLWNRCLTATLFHVGKTPESQVIADFFAYKELRQEASTNSKKQRSIEPVYLFSRYLEPALLEFFCVELIPNISDLARDEEKLIGWSTMIINAFITPIVKARTFPEAFAEMHLDLLVVFSRYSSLCKSWKKEFWDIFNDNNLFRFDTSQLRKLAPVIHVALYQDLTRLSDLITKSDLGMTALFTSRDAQLGVRQGNLCRITIFILSCHKDFFLPSLPPIIDLIKRLLGSDPEGVLKKELFLIIRALALRTTSTHLLSLWPVVISELQIVFQKFCMADATISKETLVDACKLLDFLSALKPEEFSLHEWILMMSPLDAVYWNSRTSPKPLVHLVAERLKDSSSDLFEKNSIESSEHSSSVTLRTPSLPAYPTDGQLRQFLNAIPIDVYEESYSLSVIDLYWFEESIYRELLQRFSVPTSSSASYPASKSSLAPTTEFT